MTYKEKLMDARWKSLAKKVKERDRWTCRDCKKTSRDAVLEVHHLYYFKGGPWVTEASYWDDKRNNFAWESLTREERYFLHLATWDETTRESMDELALRHLVTLCPCCHKARGDLEQRITRYILMAMNGLTVDDRKKIDKLFGKVWPYDKSSVIKALLFEEAPGSAARYFNSIPDK